MRMHFVMAPVIAFTFSAALVWSADNNPKSKVNPPANAKPPAAKDKSAAPPKQLAVPMPVNLKALRLGIEYLAATFPQQYKNGAAHLKALEALEKAPTQTDAKFRQDYDALLRTALATENPLMDFDKLLLVKREAGKLGLPHNWQGNSSINPNMANEIDTLAWKNTDAKAETFYKPTQNVFVGDIDLNFDADKLLFSSIGTNNRWQVFEIKADGTGLHQITPGDSPDIDSYDPMFLADGRILFVGSSGFQGVPCVGGADYVGNLHIMTPDGKNIRRLTYDQDNDWCPTMMSDGSVMFTRWEYTDSAHYFSRTLMRMNPDGTNQTAHYHSNSYWPNSIFYARQIPNAPSQFVCVISGHHGVTRMGELVLFDVAKGRHEAEGAVQRIPGYGKKVEPIIKDGLVNDSWPKFLHPYPLNDKYFLVSMQPKGGMWGLYLVDVFDNLILLKEEPGFALLEPVPMRKNERPRAIADKIKPGATTATVMLQDVYAGPGLKGVPRGTVKNLRVFQYEYSYRNMGGHYVVGMEGPWDVRRLIGTVPVQPDGSAMFEIPANTPVAVQPLDPEGKALQQMRSWFVGMPGEVVSCTGCHESQNDASMVKSNTASQKKPMAPTPWYGPKRGFSFVREVQPMLDKYCAGCHDGKQAKPNLADSTIIKTSGGMSQFPLSYTELHPFVRRNGPEGDYHLLTPLEFHADTSELVQMLKRGHYNVKLDAEAWDRLITWIDLNVPCYGTWHEINKIPNNFAQRRYEMKKQYAGIDEDIEAIPEVEKKPIAFIKPEPMPPKPAALKIDGWPLGAEKAKQMQQAAGAQECKLDLGGGQSLALKRIPAGTFAMGDVNGELDEYPMTKVTIEKPFFMGATEVTLAQFQQFDPTHFNGYYDQHYKDQVRPGYLMDNPNFPVIRVSWNEVMGFCKWLSQKSGKKVTLPTEAQWEWACRAGTDTPLFYGDLDADFSKFANLGDKSLTLLAVKGVDPKPFPNPDKFWDFVPKEARFNDGVLHLAEPGKYQPNAWGLNDMHGNVAEWTLTNYRPYPYDVKAGAGDVTTPGRKVVRGGSWYERPKYARSSFRLSYPEWMAVYNVGFRVIIEE
ncbi:MAG TPA: SUMF1/EgtB/PvdO family nonheme iron enzyme [Planctomycetota bacterium]